MLINIYTSNLGAPTYMKGRLLDLKGEIDYNTLIVGDLNTALSSLDRSSRQKISKEVKDLNDTINQIDLQTSIELSTQKPRDIVFFSCPTWNLFKDKPHDRAQSKLLQI